MSDGRKWVYYFSDPPPAGAADLKALLGGKGASLKEMTRAGLRVPPGFTLTTECCEAYFGDGRRWPEGLEAEVRANLERLEKDLGRTFGRGQRPLLVSVRSGAAASMPGMMDTLLNCGLHAGLARDLGDSPWFWDVYRQFVAAFARIVHGLDAAALGAERAEGGAPLGRAQVEACLARYAEQTGQPFPATPWDALVQCINAVFESWLSERARAYRERHDIRGLKGTAVNVQAMFPSEISGIVFTQDPTNLAADQLVIESAYGLGESVVSGDVAPDRFLVSRREPAKIQTALGHKVSMVSAFGQARRRDPDAASLTPPQVSELGELALRIERHFGAPMDIEWGWAEGAFALLQCRPIRGLEVAQEVEVARLEEVARLQSRADGRRCVWVTHNLAETLRAPTPLTWDIVRSFMSGSGGFGRLYQKLGYQPSRQVREEGFLELIGGRIYADPDRLAGLFWQDMPLAYDLDALVANRNLLDQAPTKFDAAKADALFLARLPRNLYHMWRSSRSTRRLGAHAKERFEQGVLPPYLAYVEQERARDLSKLSDEEVRAELRARRAKVLDEFGPESLLPGFFGGMAFDALEHLLAQLMGANEGSQLARLLTTALDGDLTFEQDALLHRIAQGKAGMDEFLKKFGHRCIGEMELAAPRWRENSSYLEQTVARLKAVPGRGPEEIHHANAEKRRAAEAELPATLARWGGSSFREDLEHHLAKARALLPYRESGKYYLMMGYELIRLAIQELSRRWDLGQGIYYLRLEELERYPREAPALGETIAKRRVRWQAVQRLDLPEVIDSQRLEGLGLPQTLEAAAEMQGTAMAPGVASGPARIVLDPQQAGELGRDYVLVCPSTDPGWTPLFLNARGLVVERGGVLSHGAIVARDFGIPAVACPNATRLLREGDTVRVDGNRGQVVVLERRIQEAEFRKQNTESG